MSGNTRRGMMGFLILAAAIAVQFWVWPRMPWKGDLWGWANGQKTIFGGPFAWVSMGVLAVYIGVLLVVLTGPRRSRSAHDAQAIGCLWIVVWGVMAALGLLILAAGLGWDWLVKGISAGTLVIGGMFLLGLVWEWGKKLRKG